MPEFIETTPDYPSLTSLRDKHVLVLGGGLGIGRQTGLAAAALGARVSVLDHDPDRAKSVAAEVNGLALSGDVTVRAELERCLTEAVEAHGPLHGLADIVGISGSQPLTEITDDDWRRGLDLNLTHVFLALQLASRVMTDGGSMVFVGSVNGVRSSPNQAVYGAAKAGLMNLVATASLELAPSIRVNAVAPGQTATPRVAQRHPEPDYYEKAGLQVPLRRVGQTSDIASTILFFLSDLSSWVTGQTLVVDGGAGRKYQYDL
jgi:NAD(P)-dependent dehydrogenase (short-subunit alcohol dehydrogenase family)